MQSDNKNRGYTLFRPTGVKFEYSFVDVENKKVSGTISYNGKVYMTVIVGVNPNSVEVEESAEELKEVSSDKESYIRMFKSEAKFFIENNISNPKEYYEQFK